MDLENQESLVNASTKVLTSENSVDTQDLESFAKLFKQKRTKLGFTQADVGMALGAICGIMYSQTTICRFEVLQLSFKKMCQLMPLLQQWMDSADKGDGKLNSMSVDGVIRRKKKRMTIDSKMKEVLESNFEKNTKPSGEELARIAVEMQLEKEVVRVWFCNRRQKERRKLLAMVEETSPLEVTESPSLIMGKETEKRNEQDQLQQKPPDNTIKVIECET